MLTARYTASLLETFLYVPRKNLTLSIAMPEGESLVPRARIAITRDFLKSDATHLMFIDADIGWDWRDVLRLLQCDKGVVGGIYRKKQDEVAYPANFLDTSNIARCEKTGCFLMRDIPTGFMMVSREAIDRVIRAYPDTRCMIGEGGWEAPCNQLTYSIWDMPIDETGMLLSEDYAFCRRWRQIGGEVWMHPEITLTHRGVKDYRGRIGDIITCNEEAA